MNNTKIKDLGLFLLLSVFSLGLPAVVLWLIVYNLLKGFDFNSYHTWIISVFIVSSITAWMQGNRAGVALKYNAYLTGFIASLIINIAVMYLYFRYIPYSGLHHAILLGMVFLNFIIALLGVKFSSKNLNNDNHISSLIYLISSNFILVAGVLAVILVLIIIIKAVL